MKMECNDGVVHEIKFGECPYCQLASKDAEIKRLREALEYAQGCLETYFSLMEP